MQAIPTQREIIEIDSDSDDLGPSAEDLLALDEFENAFDNEQIGGFALPRLDDAYSPAPWTVQVDAPGDYETCLTEVLEVFPDICHEHVRQLYDTRVQSLDHELRRADIAQELILQILDGKAYPKEKDRINELKRKRTEVLSSDEEEAARWKAVERGQEINLYFVEARAVLQEEFVNIPSKFIDFQLKLSGNFYATYLALDLAEYTYVDTATPPYTRLKSPRKPKSNTFARLNEMEATGYGVSELRKEVEAARKKRTKEEVKRQLKRDAAAAEAATDQEYRENGDVLECQCCFDTYPINKITHCDGDEPHFFCLECASSNAKNEIGNSHYQLTCMDGSGCHATFSREQKQRFLVAKSIETLERIQQQTELRQAELPNLSSCPFCDFAAICPPTSVDREFRCRNPECERISCRLCKRESHLPLTCEESKKENGISERHAVEEARTSALLRTCPKCGVKILKEDGCNKVICTCGGMLCDYCGKDISGVGYVHFDGAAAGGGTGKKCPTYDNFQVRRNKEVEKAEVEAMNKIRQENPNITAEDLEIKFAESTASPVSRPHQPPPGFAAFIPGHPPNAIPFPPDGGIRDPARLLQLYGIPFMEGVRPNHYVQPHGPVPYHHRPHEQAPLAQPGHHHAAYDERRRIALQQLDDQIATNARRAEAENRARQTAHELRLQAIRHEAGRVAQRRLDAYNNIAHFQPGLAVGAQAYARNARGIAGFQPAGLAPRNARVDVDNLFGNWLRDDVNDGDDFGHWANVEQIGGRGRTAH